ncbi:MAG: lytic transglycosylase, partial [Stenotrophomonas bentonitica]
MPVPVLLVRGWPLLAVAAMLSFVPEAHAQRVSARDKAKVEALDQRMTAAEKRYNAALVLVNNADPKGTNEADAALEDMEDVISACVAQKGCQVSNLLPTYKRLLKSNADSQQDSEDGTVIADGTLLEADPDHVGPLAADVPEAARAAALLNDKRHAFDTMVEYNPAVQAGIRRWLTDMRPALLTSYENYQNLRAVMWPEWEKRGLPEALLF